MKIFRQIGVGRLILVLILLSSTAATAAQIPLKPRDSSELIDQRELVVAFDMNEEPLSFDPQVTTNINSAQLFTGLTEGIVTYNPLTLKPSIGAAASITASPDKTVWTIKIRDDARFSNGDRITAKTFRDSWMALIDPDDPAEMANLLDMIKGVRQYRTGKDRDPEHVGITLEGLYTFIIELNVPSPYLLEILCHHVFAPVHPANLAHPDRIEAETFVSSGAYRVAAATDQEIYLEKNPYYWDTDSVLLEHIRIELRGSSTSLMTEFSQGLIHWSEAYIPISMLIDGEDASIFPEYSTSFFYFAADSGAYADPAVREALALLIPWDEVRKASASIYTTDTLIPQDQDYHGNTGITETDRERAFRILEDAGYSKGKNLPEMYIAIYPNAKLEKMTDIITDVWSEELEMTIIIDIVPFSIYLNPPEESMYSMAYITWIGDFYDPYSFLSLWTSDSSFNLGNYRNEQFDELIEEALLQETQNARYEMFKKAEQLLLDTAVVIPIAHGVSVNFIDVDSVRGWYPNLLNIHPFKYIYLEHDSSPHDSSL